MKHATVVIPFRTEIPQFDWSRSQPETRAAVLTGAIGRLREQVPGVVRTRLQLVHGGIRISVFEHRQTELAKLARSILNNHGSQAPGKVMIFGDTYKLKRWQFDAGRWCWCVSMPKEGTILADRVFDWWKES